jgi:hypothetical protein
MTLPTRRAILSRPRNGRRSRRVAAAIVSSSFVGGREQLSAGAGAVLGQYRVVAAQQPLPGIVGMTDLDQVLLVEQRQLQRAVLSFSAGRARYVDG